MNVLVPTREASAYCKSLQPLTTLWNATWEAFNRGTTVEKAAAVHSMLTKKDLGDCREKLEAFCKMMVQKGFFMEIQEAPDAALDPAEKRIHED